MLHKEIKGDELYLYMNGKLIYKRWIKTGVSKVFDLFAYNKYTLTSIQDLQFENQAQKISIKAKLRLKSTFDGGRKTGINSGYRPNHVFEYRIDEKLYAYMGEIIFDNYETIEPGEEKVVTVNFHVTQPIEEYLNKGRKWFIHEGPMQIGEAEIV
ncbi:hypothetical protein CLU83_0578 [Flavobacterium sp. 1]|uniref:hypothetical protein n=1 Tax=Flavobacterium sp. 1 TaxID=2035200 RepID=UPI000CA9B571|nr:hypothetical protein [Flavobacterium sp. 1]PJJ07409.1 hypothetical protein CLU83_0578 [Flavobacterium sp. 1]